MAGYELPTVSPPDVPALMPPASQAVEQRPARPADRTGVRWGLRVLVVGGLAGAAWMLSGAAAHAAEHPSAESATGGLTSLSPVAGLSPVRSLDPLVRGLGNGTGRTVKPIAAPVTKAIEPVTRAAVAQVDRTVHKHHRPTDVTLPGSVTHQLTSIVEPAARLVTTVDQAVRSTDDTGGALSGATAVVRELTAPLRLTGGPVGTTVLAPVTRAVTTAPLIRTPRPTAATPPRAADPVTATRGTAPAAVRHAPAPAPGLHGAAVNVPLRAVGPSGRVAAGSELRTMGGPGTDMRRHADVARHTAATTARPDSVQPAPGSPDPAPVRGHLGAVSGIPATASGSPSEGGCGAILPAAVVAGTVACHRLPIATDVEVRRYDAESPTVSPD
jgi:hypothetical protein